MVTWQYDRGMRAEESLVCLEKTNCSGFGNQTLSVLGFPSSDFWILHSKELARRPGWSFLNELVAPSASQGVLSICSGGRGGGLFLCCWELANKPLRYCVMPGEQSYQGRIQGAGLPLPKRDNGGKEFHQSVSSEVCADGPPWAFSV